MSPTPDSYWLALRRVSGVGPRTCLLLLEKFGAPEKIFGLDEAEIIAAGVPRQTARNIRRFKEFEALEKELCELPRIGARLVTWNDPDYPPNLRHIADPPPYLFVRGEMDLSERRCVAVVGARAASDAGRHMAHRLGLELAARGLAVVSGLARGVDAEAHRGALEAGGRTLAVMGCGIDVIYPPEHRGLAEEMVASGGALISELPVGMAPHAENFPPRNRILSGLCLGVVIVEAAEKSGSLITARMALEQGRQVFAVPGSPLNGKTRGSNRLIKQGASLVECVDDVIEELAPQLDMQAPAPQEATQRLRPSERRAEAAKEPGGPSQLGSEWPVAWAKPNGEQEHRLLECLKGEEKLHIDSIIESSGLSAQSVLRLLLELELKGMVTQHPGKLFSLPKSGTIR